MKVYFLNFWSLAVSQEVGLDSHEAIPLGKSSLERLPPFTRWYYEEISVLGLFLTIFDHFWRLIRLMGRLTAVNPPKIDQFSSPHQISSVTPSPIHILTVKEPKKERNWPFLTKLPILAVNWRLTSVNPLSRALVFIYLPQKFQVMIPKNE